MHFNEYSGTITQKKDDFISLHSLLWNSTRIYKFHVSLSLIVELA